MNTGNRNLFLLRRYGDIFLRVLAVVADVIAVVSILSFDRSSNSQTSLAIYMTPPLALAIWAVSAFTYIGLLQRFWRANQQRQQLQASFGRFLIEDLIRKFSEPFLLLPPVVFAILLVWILVEIVKSAIWLQIALGIAAFFVIAIGLAIMMESARTADEPKNKVRRDVDRNWEKWEKAIQAKLARKRWIEVSDLTEQAEILGVSTVYLGYALSKYAAEHPKQTTYGTVYRRKDVRPITASKVLISLKNLPQDEFFYGG